MLIADCASFQVPARRFSNRSASGLLPSVPVLLGLLIGVGTAYAQSLPAGWSARGENRGVTFSPKDIGAGEVFEVWVAPRSQLQPGVNLQSQLSRIRQQAGATQGSNCGLVQLQSSGTVEQMCSADGAALQYMLMPVREGNEAQLVRLRAKGGDALARHLDGFKKTLNIALQGNASALLRGGGTSETPVGYSAPIKSPAPKDYKAIAKAIRANPGQGVADRQIDGIYVTWENAPIYGSGMSQIQHTTWLLLTDGTAYRGLKFPPDELNVDASRQLQPKYWTQWRGGGGRYEVRANGGAWKPLKGGWLVKPASDGTRLNGSWKNYNMSGSTFTGLNTSTSAWTFFPDGRFEISGYTTAGTGSLQATNGHVSGATGISNSRGSRTSTFVSGERDSDSGPIAAGGVNRRSNNGAANTGRYRIKGWVMELQRDNGLVERRLVTFPGDGVDMNGLAYLRVKR